VVLRGLLEPERDHGSAPALFPFLVSLIHSFWATATPTPSTSTPFSFLVRFVAYRLAKSLGGEAFGLLAGAFVVAHPITLISARSGGFDLMAGFFALVSVKCFLDYAREPTANRLPCCG